MRLPGRIIILAVFINCLWGANPVAVKFGLEVFPPLWSGFVRFTVAFVVLLLWGKWHGLPIWPHRHEWLPLALLSAFFAAQVALMNVGFGMTSGSMGAVLLALNPLFAAGFAHFLLAGDRMSRVKFAGLVVAFTGAAVVLSPHDVDGVREFTNPGNWIVLLSCIMLGARLVFSAKLLRSVDEVRVTLWMVCFSIPLFGISGAATETIHWSALGWAPVLGLLYQAIVITCFCFMVNFYLIKHYPPSVMMSFSFVSPIAGVLTSAWLLDEGVTWSLWAGLVLVAAGLVLIARRPC
ncbi:MAG: EamA family transporter [Gammaproteobacteria bacterium]|nr:EamA family transporter [Gammaproteobacteria bacterium]